MRSAISCALSLRQADARAGEMAARDGLRERVVVDEVAAGHVDDPRPGLHRGERLGIQEAPGVGGRCQVQGDEVGDRVEIRGDLGMVNAEFPVARIGDERIVGDDLHSQAQRTFGDHLPDPPEPDDAEGLPLQFDAGVLRAFPAPLHERRVGGGNVARLRQQQGDGVFGSGERVGPGRVADDDAAARGGRHVDVVDAGARPTDHLQVGRRVDELGVDLRGAADDDRIEPGDLRQQLVAAPPHPGFDREVFGERLDAALGQLLGDQYPQPCPGPHRQSAFSVSNSVLIQLIMPRRRLPSSSMGCSA